MASTADPKVVQNNSTIILSGAWTTRYLRILPQQLSRLPSGPIHIEAQDIHELDTAGALLINQYISQLQAQNIEYHLEGLKPEWLKLLSLVAKAPPQAPPTKPVKMFIFELIGEGAIEKCAQFFHFFDFIGRI